MKDLENLFLTFLGVLVGIVWIGFSYPFVVMCTWNWFAPEVFSAIGFQVQTISWVIAFGIGFLVSIVATPIATSLATYKFESKEPGEVFLGLMIAPFLSLFIMWLGHLIFNYFL